MNPKYCSHRVLIFRLGTIAGKTLRGIIMSVIQYFFIQRRLERNKIALICVLLPNSNICQMCKIISRGNDLCNYSDVFSLSLFRLCMFNRFCSRDHEIAQTRHFLKLSAFFSRFTTLRLFCCFITLLN